MAEPIKLFDGKLTLVKAKIFRDVILCSTELISFLQGISGQSESFEKARLGSCLLMPDLIHLTYGSIKIAHNLTVSC